MATFLCSEIGKKNKNLDKTARSTVLSNQNEVVSILETEELATDLISAIKEFEETTAKITSAHQKQETQTKVVQETQSQMVESVSRTEEKGPIDYFVRTKETLRHVPQINHDINNNEHKSEAPNNRNNDDDDNESGDPYMKIPVQQLINTFEKQMRSIIKQKVNENIQVKLDGTASNKIVAAPYNSNDDQYGFAGRENETKSSEKISKVVSRTNVDNELILSQQQMSERIERQVSHSLDEQYQWSTQQTTSTKNQMLDESKSSTIFESATNRFNNSNQTQLDDHLDGGKA